ncbi:unnamed protein product, partial [Closterium sp. NIES-64]
MMARLHGRVVARRSGLVFAALAALMLSGVLSCSWLCAHLLRAVSVRLISHPLPFHFLPSPPPTPCPLPHPSQPVRQELLLFACQLRVTPPTVNSCVQRNCGANAVCVKDRGSATCVCNVEFSMTPTGCVNTCALKACGGNATCIKDSAGVASCVCRAGFVLQADKKTCTDTCVLKRCGGNAKCVKSAAGVAFCACDTGFVLQPDGVTCTDACALKACGGNGTCIKDGTTGVASCVCDTGFVLQPDGITCTGPAPMGGLLPTPGATCTVLTYSKAPYPTA